MTIFILLRWLEVVFSFFDEESWWEHISDVVTCIKFVLSMKPGKAAVKMVSCLSHIKLSTEYFYFLTNVPEESDMLELMDHSETLWRIWHDGTNGLTNVPEESDMMELMELDLRTPNSSFYLRIFLLFSLLMTFCFIYGYALGRQRLYWCSRNEEPIFDFSGSEVLLSPFRVSLWSCPSVLTGLGLLGEWILQYKMCG